ncbi:MAG: glycosyltransferase [Burkholderiales bacterium]|nr:MAG: glycosyltransferase [Burkholderiales bacterium]
MNKGSVTLSVVSHEQHALVDALIADLAGIDSPELARIILTQNLPETPPSTKGRRSPPVEVVRNRTPTGFGINHNAAFRKCDTEYFAVVNPDIALMGNPFPALIAALRAGAGVAAPAVLEPDGRLADTARGLITPLELIRRRLPTYAPPETPRWFAGMFLLFRCDAFAAVGGFDEGFFMYCEDFDVCARLRLAGWPLAFMPQVQVVHAAQQLSHRSLRHFRWHIASLGRMWSSTNFWRYRALIPQLEAEEDAGRSTLRPGPRTHS